VKNQVNPRSEIALAVGLIVFSSIIYWSAQSLPEPEYEPLGSAAIPQGLAVIMSLLSLIMIVRAVPRLKSFRSTEDTNAEVIPRPLIAVSIFIISVLFVAVLDFGILPFLPAGIIYLSLIGYIMTHRDLKSLPWVVGFSIVLTVVSFYIFTKIFYIDLP